MSSGLHGRVGRLEQAFRPDPFAGIQEFRFADHVDRLPAETVVPEGGRVVQDFYEDLRCDDWGGRAGVKFRSGYYRERIATDPNDQGRIIPASEDPVLQEMLKDNEPPVEQPKPSAAEDEFVIPEDVMALYRR